MTNAPIHRSVRLFLGDTPPNSYYFRRTILGEDDKKVGKLATVITILFPKLELSKQRSSPEAESGDKQIIKENADAIAGFFYRLWIAKNHEVHAVLARVGSHRDAPNELASRYAALLSDDYSVLYHDYAHSNIPLLAQSALKALHATPYMESKLLDLWADIQVEGQMKR